MFSSLSRCSTQPAPRHSHIGAANTPVWVSAHLVLLGVQHRRNAQKDTSVALTPSFSRQYHRERAAHRPDTLESSMHLHDKSRLFRFFGSASYYLHACWNPHSNTTQPQQFTPLFLRLLLLHYFCVGTSTQFRARCCQELAYQVWCSSAGILSISARKSHSDVLLLVVILRPLRIETDGLCILKT